MIFFPILGGGGGGEARAEIRPCHYTELDFYSASSYSAYVDNKTCRSIGTHDPDTEPTSCNNLIIKSVLASMHIFLELR